jgi:hypothetical protein
LHADEIQSDWWIYLEGNESVLISALTGRMSYEPGCDRTAVEISKQFARTITETESLVEPPSLRTDCVSFSAASENLSAQNVGNNVVLNWAPVSGATHYEVSQRLSPSGEWTSPTTVVANASTVMSTTITGLSRSTDYEFRIRAKRASYGLYSDTATGPWAENVASIRTLAPPPPVVEVPVVTLAPQAAPAFPARIKAKKSIKFRMTAPSGLPLRVTSSGRCKTTATTKTVTVKVLVGKKMKKRKVKVQTGWTVKTSKKGTCTITFSNSGDSTRVPLSATGTITVF